MNILSYFGGNRCAVTIGCGIATTLLSACGKITGEVYAAVIIATVAAYITGKTTENIRSANDPV